MTNESCTIYEGCGAPLCPMQEDALKNGLWYTDEEVCRARKFQSLPWLKKQKRIAKLGLTLDDGFFTVRMLDAIRAITKHLKGANPDNPNSEEQWLKERLGKLTPSKNRGDSKARQKKSRGILAMDNDLKVTKMRNRA